MALVVAGTVRNRCTIIAILGLVALLVSTPIGSAGSLRAPFPGAYTSAWAGSLGAGCESMTQSAAPNWSVKTGVGVYEDSVSASACSKRFTGFHNLSYAELAGGWLVVVPITIPSNASGQFVNATWNFSWSETDSISVAHMCRGDLASGAAYGYLQCSIDATAEVYLWTYLVDATTNYWYGTGPSSSGTNYPSLYNYTFRERDIVCHPSCSWSNLSLRPGGSSNGSLSYPFNFTLTTPNPSDHWEIVSYSQAEVYASVQTSEWNFTGVRPLVGSADAQLDMYSHGGGAKLTRIDIT
ncbi:MAG: hypothetical protein L3K08_08610 [Thermoplasmata archaeon]|nr:hypothetical protein [Thermoplasmata archaeon]